MSTKRRNAKYNAIPNLSPRKHDWLLSEIECKPNNAHKRNLIINFTTLLKICLVATWPLIISSSTFGTYVRFYYVWLKNKKLAGWMHEKGSNSCGMSVFVCAHKCLELKDFPTLLKWIAQLWQCHCFVLCCFFFVCATKAIFASCQFLLQTCKPVKRMNESVRKEFSSLLFVIFFS